MRALICRWAVGARHRLVGRVYPEACAVVDAGRKPQPLVGGGVDLQTGSDREKALDGVDERECRDSGMVLGWV